MDSRTAARNFPTDTRQKSRGLPPESLESLNFPRFPTKAASIRTIRIADHVSEHDCREGPARTPPRRARLDSLMRPSACLTNTMDQAGSSVRNSVRTEPHWMEPAKTRPRQLAGFPIGRDCNRTENNPWRGMGFRTNLPAPTYQGFRRDTLGATRNAQHEQRTPWRG